MTNKATFESKQQGTGGGVIGSLNDPHRIASQIVGAVDWQSEVSGYCRCPGEALHTQKTGKKDCRVCVDGAPTIFCFHSSCGAVVAEANQRLRRELGSGHWKITLPGGQVLHSGDVLQTTGTVLSREVIQQGARSQEQRTERLLLETLSAIAARLKPEVLKQYHWPYAQILEKSPLLTTHREPAEQFRLWLSLWPSDATVWIGEVHSSGRPEHRTHFRPVTDWFEIGPVMGNYTCGSSFKADSYSRCTANLNGHRFLVVESDTLGKDEMGAIFSYLNRRLRYRLHCIIDAAGKSLHGWFDAPPSSLWENRLKAVLEALGCDPKVFTRSQPVRVPGAFRNGRLQSLIWVNR